MTTQTDITRKEQRAKRGRPQEVRIAKLHHVIPHVDYVDGNWKELDDPKYVYLTVSSDGREHEMQLTVDKTQAQWLVSWLQEETEAADNNRPDFATMTDQELFDWDKDWPTEEQHQLLRERNAEIMKRVEAAGLSAREYARTRGIS